jgi:transcription elongation factor Elf1
VQQLMQEINRVRMRHAKEDAAKHKVLHCAFCCTHVLMELIVKFDRSLTYTVLICEICNLNNVTSFLCYPGQAGA